MGRGDLCGKDSLEDFGGSFVEMEDNLVEIMF